MLRRYVIQRRTRPVSVFGAFTLLTLLCMLFAPWLLIAVAVLALLSWLA